MRQADGDELRDATEWGTTVMKVLTQIATAAAVVFSLASGPALAYGAIAVDDDVEAANEAGFGWATGAASRKEAEHRAIEACREHGNDSCKVVVWFETCGAYAASKGHTGIGYGASREVARREALDKCGTEHCRIIVAECE